MQIIIVAIVGPKWMEVIIVNEVKKLTKLMRDLDVYAYNLSFEEQAQFLIANGVTFVKDENNTHGHWILRTENSIYDMTYQYECSQCKQPSRCRCRTTFCPNCGAKMMEVNNE